MTGVPAAAAPQRGPDTFQVIELRQYQTAPGRRDELATVFEQQLIEAQEAEGMWLVGQFRDADAADRFTWIRGFRDMDQRQQALTAFYTGPVWRDHRDAVNPLLEDNDNVLLLRPAATGWGFRQGKPEERTATGAPVAAAGVIIATVHTLWKTPDAGFDAHFNAVLMPRLEAAGLDVMAAYVPETADNTFPRLPVRPGGKVFVWFAWAPDLAAADAALARLRLDGADWPAGSAASRQFEERRPQVLRLLPTPRSGLR